MYQIKYSKKAIKDIANLKFTNLEKRAKEIIGIIAQNPYETPPQYEKLVGELSGTLSRKINAKYRIVYQVFEDKKAVKIISMCSHNESKSPLF
ncbi:MAG: Txe/YoeB family addiction module toxin [Chitinivibrionia bacterium]|jgi:Txe/YoeB family toxin of toxin-antitoxin system|nr:Txe/YoeB family addiction module toxin [Chitinivibrionia bacterium]